MGSISDGRLANRVLAAQHAWWVEHLKPLRDRMRAVGVVRATPGSLGIVLVSLAATAVVRLPNPLQHDASAVFVYHGRDLHTTAALYQLPLSALLAQSWPQWAWTALVAAALFAPLEVRIGPARLLGCLLAGQVLSTAAADIQAAYAGRGAELAAPDFGTSCLVVSAAAGYAWLTRSRMLGATLGTGLCIDAILSAPLTIIEHWVAAGIGILVVSARTAAAAPPAWQATVLIRMLVPRAGASRLAEPVVTTRTAWDVSHFQRIHCEVR